MKLLLLLKLRKHMTEEKEEGEEKQEDMEKNKENEDKAEDTVYAYTLNEENIFMQKKVKSSNAERKSLHPLIPPADP